MNARTCCARAVESAGVILPGITLVLLPKCPACVAAYIGLATGLGISFSLASHIRWALLAGSVLALVALTIRLAVRWRPHRAEIPENRD